MEGDMNLGPWRAADRADLDGLGLGLIWCSAASCVPVTLTVMESVHHFMEGH